MLLKNGKVYLKGDFAKADIRVRDGVITEILLRDASEVATLRLLRKMKVSKTGIKAEKGEKTINCAGKKIIPGLIDIHTHGCMGSDFTKDDAEADAAMCEYYAKNGVTGVIATLMTDEPDVMEQGCREIRKLMKAQKDVSTGKGEDAEADPVYAKGARILGINMEGPFLARQKKGAHDAKYLMSPQTELFERLNKASGGTIRLVTVAPELEGALDFIGEHKNKVHVSLGHSACDYDQAIAGFDMGADHVTHIFNAMNGLGHREPGLVAASSDRPVYVELICDGLHVDPSVVRLAFRFYSGRVVIISDSIAPSGLPDGEYTAGGLKVTKCGQEIRLSDGTLAGSGITIFEGMKRAISFGVSEKEAIDAVTVNPAKSVGLDKQAGVIAVGRRADMLICSEDYSECEVLLSGEVF